MDRPTSRFEFIGDDGEIFRLTPKGFFCFLMSKTYNATYEQANENWLQLEAFCIKILKCNDLYSDSPYAALVFNGEGGDVIGLEEIEPDG